MFYAGQGHLECHFVSSDEKPCPFVQTIYNLDLSGGTLEFDGHFYLNDADFPVIQSMHLYQSEKEPYKCEDNTYYYKEIMNELYLVEIIRRELITDTSESWYDEEVGGNICLFPTHRQKIYFKILHTDKASS